MQLGSWQPWGPMALLQPIALYFVFFLGADAPSIAPTRPIDSVLTHLRVDVDLPVIFFMASDFHFRTVHNVRVRVRSPTKSLEWPTTWCDRIDLISLTN